MTTQCQTFIHHVDTALRVECAQHPAFVVDVDPQPKGEPTAREIATAARHEHEAEHPHDVRCRLPLPHDNASCLAWAAERVAINRAEAMARRP